MKSGREGRALFSVIGNAVGILIVNAGKGDRVWKHPEGSALQNPDLNRLQLAAMLRQAMRLQKKNGETPKGWKAVFGAFNGNHANLNGD